MKFIENNLVANKKRHSKLSITVLIISLINIVPFSVVLIGNKIYGNIFNQLFTPVQDEIFSTVFGVFHLVLTFITITLSIIDLQKKNGLKRFPIIALIFSFCILLVYTIAVTLIFGIIHI